MYPSDNVFGSTRLALVNQIAFERLLEMGICPGRHLTVLYRPTNGAIMARTDGGHPIVIGSDLASGIMCVAAG